MTTLLEVRDRSRWCSFHKDHGHTTEECMSLKRHVEGLVSNGYLDYFVDTSRTKGTRLPRLEALDYDNCGGADLGKRLE